MLPLNVGDSVQLFSISITLMRRCDATPATSVRILLPRDVRGFFFVYLKKEKSSRLPLTGSDLPSFLNGVPTVRACQAPRDATKTSRRKGKKKGNTEDVQFSRLALISRFSLRLASISSSAVNPAHSDSAVFLDTAER